MSRSLRVVAPALVTAALTAAVLLGCGRKGAPLPPLPGMKPAVSDLQAWQVGNEIRASFSLPVRPEQSIVDYATVGVELWRRPHDEAAAESELEEGIAQFRESSQKVVSLEGEAIVDFLAARKPLLVDVLPSELLRGGPLEYAVILRTNVVKRGSLSNLAVVTPHPPPAAPTGLAATLEESGVRLDFVAPPAPEPEPAAEAAPGSGTEGAEAAPAEGGEEAAAESKPAAPAALQFNVYRAEGDRAYEDEPLNDKPLATPSMMDKSVRAGRTYRYQVRSVAELDGDRVESAPSSEVVVLFHDVFAPRVPEGLRLILETRRSVALIWNPNNEPDLGGYAVFRREAGGDWVRLDSGTARTATFTDTNVAPGVTYEYAVSAFDTARPSNESEKSPPQSIAIPALAGAP